MEDYIKIGYTQKSHGVKGEIKVFIEEEYEELLEELALDTFYLKIKNSLVPYFLERVRGATGNIYKFEDVDSKEVAQQISSKELYIKGDFADLGDLNDLEILEYHYLIGFSVKDKHHGELGVFDDIEAFPQQEMGLIKYNGKDIYIPLNDHIILSIDDEKEYVYVDLPDGLLNL